MEPLYVRWTRPLFEGFARLVFRVYCPLTVVGRERLPPMPFLFCSNHASHMDSIILMAASGKRFGNFGLLAADDYFFRNPMVHRCFSCLVHLIPISRKPTPGSLTGTVQECRKFLGEGPRSLILFPEGTRSVNGEMGTFKRGAGMLALRLGLPLVPAYIQGTHKAMPKGRFFPTPGPVRIQIGDPIYPEDMPSASNGDGYEFLVAEAKKRIEAMKGPAGVH